MLLKIICLIFFICTYIIHSNCAQLGHWNRTNAVHSINSQLSEIRAELLRQGNYLIGSPKGTVEGQPRFYGRNCAEATAKSNHSGIYEILIPSYSEYPFEVACDATTQGGGWTIILRRVDGSVNFYRKWTTYQKGFGDLDGELFLGLDKIHALTAKYGQELLVVLEDNNGVVKYEKYDNFAIGDEDEQYALHTLGKASGQAGDSFSVCYTMKFSTFDRDNDISNHNMAELYHGAWWYKNEHQSNLAGRYNTDYGYKGVYWAGFHNREYSLKKAVMMIRPRK